MKRTLGNIERAAEPLFVDSDENVFKTGLKKAGVIGNWTTGAKRIGNGVFSVSNMHKIVSYVLEFFVRLSVIKNSSRLRGLERMNLEALAEKYMKAKEAKFLPVLFYDIKLNRGTELVSDQIIVAMQIKLTFDRVTLVPTVAFEVRASSNTGETTDKEAAKNAAIVLQHYFSQQTTLNAFLKAGAADAKGVSIAEGTSYPRSFPLRHERQAVEGAMTAAVQIATIFQPSQGFVVGDASWLSKLGRGAVNAVKDAVKDKSNARRNFSMPRSDMYIIDKEVEKKYGAIRIKIQKATRVGPLFDFFIRNYGTTNPDTMMSGFTLLYQFYNNSRMQWEAQNSINLAYMAKTAGNTREEVGKVQITITKITSPGERNSMYENRQSVLKRAAGEYLTEYINKEYKNRVKDLETTYGSNADIDKMRTTLLESLATYNSDEESFESDDEGTE